MSDTLSLQQMEDELNKWVRRYAQEVYNLPKHAVRLVLYPLGIEKWVSHITRGPTAVLQVSLPPSHPRFFPLVKEKIDLIAKRHMYDCLAIEKVAYITERTEDIYKTLRVRYNFDAEMVPHMPRDEDLIVRIMSRVEVVHRDSGIREVLEIDTSSGRNLFELTILAKSRLASRVMEEAEDNQRAP